MYVEYKGHKQFKRFLWEIDKSFCFTRRPNFNLRRANAYVARASALLGSVKQKEIRLRLRAS